MPASEVRLSPTAAGRSISFKPWSVVRSVNIVFAVGVVAVAAVIALSIGIHVHDFWWHIATGRLIMETAAIPTTDTFTYTQSGQPFFNQMWLPQILMYQLYRAGGGALVLTVHAIVISGSSAMLLAYCSRLGQRTRLAAAVMVLAVIPLSFFNWGVRPQAYALPLFVAVVIICFSADGSSSSTKRLWLLPVLMALWVNTHGSFVIGLATIGLVAVVDGLLGWRTKTFSAATRALLAAAAASLAATLLNPAGIGIYGYVLRLMMHPSVAEVDEWRPVDVSDPQGLTFVTVAVAVVLLMVLPSRRPPTREAVVVTFLLALGFTASRNGVWFAIAAAPILTAQLASVLRPEEAITAKPAVNAGMLLAIGGAVVLMTPWVRSSLPNAQVPLYRDTPIGAVAALDAVVPRDARIFNDLGYGSYIAWAAPERKVFMDTRFELFPIEQLRDYQDLSDGRFVDELAAKYRFDVFLVSHRYQRPLVDALLSNKSYEKVYSDDEAALFLARGGIASSAAWEESGE